MRKVLSAIGMATLAATIVVAQGPPPQTKPAQTTGKDAATMVGCVASGPGGMFQLTNATMGGGTTAQEKKSDTAAANATYNLTGGENLKAHVGHKVEVTGTVTPGASAADKSAAGSKPPTGAASANVRGSIAVTNVKMVSTTCP